MPPENSQSSQITDKTAVPSVHTDQTVDEQLDYFIEASPLPGASFAALELVESRASRNGLEKIQSNHMERVSSGNPPSGKDLEKLDTNDGAENTELDEGWRNRGWQVVIASFLVNFCVFGITFSWGILQDYYLQTVYAGQTDSFRISFVGTIGSACVICTGIFIAPLVQRIGFRPTMMIGTILAPLGLILSSFANQLWQVYLSQGVLYGFGGALVFSPSISLPPQWFDKYRSLATGISVCGSGIGGLALSPLTSYLIAAVGYRMTLRYLGIFIFGLLAIACVLAKARWTPKKDGKLVLIDTSLLTTDMLIFMLFGIVVPFGYLTPYFLIPQYGSSIGVLSSETAVIVGVMSACNAISRVALGFLADRYGRINALFGCTFLAGVFTMVIWINAKTFGSLFAFGILYGLTGGGYVSLLPTLTADLVGIRNLSRGLGMIYTSSLFGTLFGTPLSGILSDQAGYTACIEFAGAMTLLSSLIMFVLRQRRSKGAIFCKI
ncbi:major facilitator superfamily domain-containing protein [Umbelopsis sp. PMI_123]|nr:major facilitator superfamily domain-containing protein [Umbelopsis sp. PMI_123]